MSEVFFDRETQLETLDEIGRRVASGRGALAIVEGIAGIGKSALVREFLRKSLDKSGDARCRIVLTRCHGQVGSGDAYGPIIMALRELKPARHSRLRRASKAAAGSAPDLAGPSCLLGHR